MSSPRQPACTLMIANLSFWAYLLNISVKSGKVQSVNFLLSSNVSVMTTLNLLRSSKWKFPGHPFLVTQDGTLLALQYSILVIGELSNIVLIVKKSLKPTDYTYRQIEHVKLKRSVTDLLEFVWLWLDREGSCQDSSHISFRYFTEKTACRLLASCFRKRGFSRRIAKSPRCWFCLLGERLWIDREGFCQDLSHISFRFFPDKRQRLPGFF